MRHCLLACCTLLLLLTFPPAPVAQLGNGESVKGEKIDTPAGAFLDIGTNSRGYREFRRAKDGAAMVLVPGGDFPKRDYVRDPVADQIEFMVSVESFLIDKYEVTNAQVIAFLNAQKGVKYEAGKAFGANEKLWAKSHKWGLEITATGASVVKGFEQFPAVGCTGYLAESYALWVGGGLPYEFEWEKAAAGTNALEFPWGATLPDSTRTNAFFTGPRHTMPVGSYPMGASPYGVMDMAGNVYERAYDFDRPADIKPEVQPTMLKGGSWVSAHWANLRNCDRCGQGMDAAEGTVGFRTVIRDKSVLKALAIDTQPKLLMFDETEKALEEASKRNVPILLFLGYQTCGATDRVRSEIFTDPRFIEYCNEKIVVLIGYNAGDGAQDPVPEGADGMSQLIPGLKQANIEKVFDEFVRAVDVHFVPEQIRQFKMSPAMFMLMPHKDLMEETDHLVLVPEGKLPKSGDSIEKFFDQFEIAQKMLGEGQKRSDFLAGKPAPKTSWKAPEPKD